MQRSLEVREKTLGPDHPEVASALVMLADDLMDRGEYRQAEPMFRRALAIQQQVPGEPDDKARKTERLYESQIRRAVLSAEAMDDPTRRPTEADLKYLNGLEIGPDAPDIMNLFNQTSMYIHDRRLDDAGLAHIRGLVNLESVNLSGGFTDAGLAHIEKLTNLREVTIHERQEATPGPAEPLFGLKELFLRGPVAGMLHLATRPAVEVKPPATERSTGMTDAGLAHIEKLVHLEELTIYGPSAITDAGMAHIAKLGQLESLAMIGAKLHGPGLVHLRGLSRLRELNLACTAIDDAGLAQLPPLASLQALNLAFTEIDDAGLVYLRKLTGLCTLNLEGAKVTDAGIAKLKHALPEVKVSRNEQPLIPVPRVFEKLEANPSK